jgi:glycosyltransferase involved in cell wall biosynthesis
VTHIIPSLATGGAEIMLEQLLASIDHRCFRQSVVCLAPQTGPIERRLRSHGIDILHCRVRRAIPNLAGAIRLTKAVRQLNPDVLHGWMYHGNLACSFAAATHMRKIPVLWSVHNLTADIRSVKWSTAAAVWAGGRLSALPEAITSPSQRTLANHVSRLGYHGARWEVIPNGFDTDRFKPSTAARERLRSQLGIPGHVPVVGLFGRYAPVKDHANFLQAAARLRTAIPEVRFILAGQGLDPANQELQRIVIGLRLEDSVLLLGERQDMPDLMNALDLLALSSRSECFPMVIGEAMACGVPCVTTDVGDAGVLIGDTGRLVPPRDPVALADAIRALIELPPSVRASLGEQARQHIKKHFSLREIARRFENLYRRLADAHTVSAAGGVAAA